MTSPSPRPKPGPGKVNPEPKSNDPIKQAIWHRLSAAEATLEDKVREHKSLTTKVSDIEGNIVFIKAEIDQFKAFLGLKK